MTRTVLLTGITGFIAKKIAKDLLAAGHTVRGSLRSPRREGEVRAAVAAQGTQNNLSFVQLDLTADDGWADAMEGVDTLIHCASPFPMSEPKDENALIKPAVDGTLRALKAAHAAGITRVVLTSSMVAIMHKDKPAGQAYGPEDWTDTAHPTAGAYVKSKTLAERAAWDFVAQHPEMEMTTVNPGLVVGSPVDKHYGTSLQLIERMMGGKDPMVPNVGFPVVDVADVSKLHVEALTRPETIGKRIIAVESDWTLPEMTAYLKTEFPDRKIPTRIAPKFMLRILSLFDPSLKHILPQVGRFTATDMSETKALYGMEFIPGKTSIRAAAQATLEA